MKVTASALNVRSGPGTEFRVLGRLERGDEVQIREEHGVWAWVSPPGGWVHSGFLEESAPEPQDEDRTISEALTRVNFSRGRQGHAVDVVVIHVMVGTMAGTLSWFRNPEANVSAHYGISRAGEIVRYVEEEDAAWHAGEVVRPTAELVRARPGVNPNLYSIGIENEGTGREPPTEEQLRANVWLVQDIAARHPGVKIDRTHVIGHREIKRTKTCPGMIDVDEIVRRASP